MILLDTSFIVAYYNIRDENHSKAAKIMERLERGECGRLCITDYIFDECITVIFIRLKSLDKTVEIGETIRNLAKMLEIGKVNFEDSWEIFKNQRETAFSFTDCTTVSLMEKEGIENIATFDEDFQKLKEMNVVS